MKINITSTYLFAFSAIILSSCATEHAKFGKNIDLNSIKERKDSSNIAHTFYLIGDAGNADQPKAQQLLKNFKTRLDQASDASTLIFLGDNIYEHGMPGKNDPNRKQAEEKLDFQMALTDHFKGKTIFIPGNHDWYSNGIIGLKEQQDYLVEKMKDKNAFLPKNSCAIDSKKIGKDITLIVIDSEWFLADWNKNTGINEKCDIKTREDFFTEFEDLLGKNQNKTVVVAIHHPLIDHGSHGGQYALEKQLFPIEKKIPMPALGSLINLVRSTSGISHQDLSNANYRLLSERLQTIIADRKNVIIVSGHDHNLQYSEHGNIRQIISGAGSKSEAAGIKYDSDFSYGNSGYALLKITTTGDAFVEYYGLNNGQENLIFSKDIIHPVEFQPKDYHPNFSQPTMASVYPTSATEKSNFYQKIWGKNYRNFYSTPVEAPTIDLDQLLGGATPTRTGGGHQTHSLRLDTPNGEYVLRGLKKSGVRFLQSVAFKNQYVVEDFKDTFADRFLLDFYTSSNPFTPLAIGTFTDALHIKQTQPELIYLPKQKALGTYNRDFGDELYYLEKRPKEDGENFDKIYNTNEAIALLAKDAKYKINEKNYIRARLFDMLIGDWDRHFDQWKWEQKIDGNTVWLSPIPKDRDQAFVKYDGALTKLILRLPALRHMQSFGPNIKNIKWFNMEAFPLDMVFAKNATEKDWLAEADFIQNQLSTDLIKTAFDNLPKEVQNEQIEEIKQNLEIRKMDLKKYASEYYKVLQHTVILTGTNKKDRFVIHRNENGTTKVTIYKTNKDGEELDFEKSFSPKETSEIWIYGLANEDLYQSTGNGKPKIKVRLIGGRENDIYQIENAKKLIVYDDNKGKNTVDGNGVSTRFTNLYNINTYDYRKSKYNYISSLPNAGFNPDDGVMIGQVFSFVNRGFKSPEFARKHSFITSLYTKTLGFEVGYTAVIPFLNSHWNFSLDTAFSNSKFIKNYFGMGNGSMRDSEKFDNEYYRVRAQEFHVKPTINWDKNATHFSAGLMYETMKIFQSKDRYISSGIFGAETFSTHQFVGFSTAFNYENMNRKVNPSLGMKFDLGFQYKQNLENTDNKVPQLDLGLGFIHHIDRNEKLNLSTYAQAKWLLSDKYQFFQMATLGGNKTLRGYHFDRFYGKTSFYQTTDMRYDFGMIKNYFVPLNVGIFGGFDYGKVWTPNQNNRHWHYSYGGGMYLNAINQFAVQASYFRSPEGGRLVVGAGLNF